MSKEEKVKMVKSIKSIKSVKSEDLIGGNRDALNAKFSFGFSIYHVSAHMFLNFVDQV
jgi:hypothetical protein